MVKEIVKKEAKKEEVVKKYFVLDTNDRDFRANGHDVVLVANEKLEVSKEAFVALKKEFPYLTFSE